MKNNNRKGMAMIAAIMTAFIFLALVSTLCLLATSGSRQANYTKRATIALHLAEAGIADAIYRLNYPHLGDGNYPFDSSEMPFGSTLSGIGATAEIDDSFGGGTYTVKFDDSNPDKITSTGSYKGTKRTLSVQLRGKNVVGTLRQDPGQGIPEAFNKHVIYAGTISGSGNYSITGNLCGVTLSLLGTAGGQYTVTTVPSALSDTCQADTDITFPVEPASFNVYFCDGGRCTDSTCTDTSLPLPSGITYVANEYVFTDTQIDYSFYIKGKNDPRDIRFVHAAGTQNRASKFVRADGAITISDDITTDTVMATDSATFRASSITVSANRTIHGDFIVENTPIITLNAGVVIEGTLGCDGDITLGSSITINPTLSGGSREAAIIGYSTTGDITITIDATPTDITLGSAQKKAIIAYSSGGDATVKIGDTVDVDLTGIDFGSKAAIVAYSKNDDAYVYLGSAGNSAKVKGAIYSSGKGAGNITLEHASTEVTGALVASGTVTLTAGTLSWDKQPFVDATNTDTEIYQGFSGGRRVYLPVLGSWRQE